VSPPELEPVKSRRLSEAIIRQLQDLIAEGRLKPGERLPAERELAEQLGVSRTSVREALRGLETRGLVEIRVGEGAFVREGSLDSALEPLAFVVAPQIEVVKELFEARRLIEPAIAALAARRATEAEIQAMERILEGQARELDGGGIGLRQDVAFHAALANSAHNRSISRIINAVMELLAPSRRVSLGTPGRPRQSHEDHWRILDAIRQRDELAAHRAVLDHLIAAERLVTGGYGEPAEAPPTPRRRRS
jgi:GntR family transcriptional repressor for pyruvate dehydrogenase complex